MYRPMLIALSLLLLLSLTACSGGQSSADTDAGPAGGQVMALVKKANTCQAGDFNCKPLSDLKKALKKQTAFTAADFNAYMQAATSSGAQSALVTTYGDHMTPEMLDAVIPLMTHEDWGLRRAAQKAVAAVGNDQAVTALVKLLDEGADDVRELIPVLLAEKADSPQAKQAVSTLKKLAEQSENSALRSNAVKAVAKIDGKNQINWLVRIAKKSDLEAARESAIRGLEPWADQTTVYNCLVDISKGSNEQLARLAKRIAVKANEK